MAEKTEITLAPLPEGLAAGKSPHDVTAPGAPAAPAKKAKPEPEEDVDDQDDDELDMMSLEELADVCGDIYADAFRAAAEFYVGAPVELDDKRAHRRGRQIATVLRKAGWADDEILCYVGLTTGVLSDAATLHRAKLALEADRARHAHEAEAKGAEA